MNKQDRPSNCTSPHETYNQRPSSDGVPLGKPANGRASIVRDMTDELIALAHEMNAWGVENGFPSIRDYPQYARLKEIGQVLFDQGGYHAMDHALSHVGENPEFCRASVTRLIEFGWDGIGRWQA